MLRKRRKTQHFVKLRPNIISLLSKFDHLYLISEKRKTVNKFKFLLKGLNQNEAAIKIQKVWRGYVRRKLYKKLKQKKQANDDSDFEDVDIDFFDNELEKVEFDVDLEGFEDIIIRPEVFDILKAK